MTIHSGTPPPPDNDRVSDHNAMPAFPQEKNSHYTTAGDVQQLENIICNYYTSLHNSSNAYKYVDSRTKSL